MKKLFLFLFLSISIYGQNPKIGVKSVVLETNGTHYVTATGSTTTRSVQDRWSERRYIRDFGGDPTGATESTAAGNAAIASLSPGVGGVIVFDLPPGASSAVYKGNWTILNNNIRFVGYGGAQVTSNSTTVSLQAWTGTQPVIQVGNDSGRVTGFWGENLTIYGTTSYHNLGVYFAGGAWESGLINCAVWQFKTNILHLGGATQPTALINIKNCRIQQSPIDDAKGIFTGWLTNRQFATWLTVSDSHISGPVCTNGNYSVYVDSTYASFVNNHFDINTSASGPAGLYITNSNLGGTDPRIFGSNNKIDTDNSARAIVTTPNSVKFLGQWLRGGWKVNGQIRCADGTLYAPPDGDYVIPYRSEITSPKMFGDLAFHDAAYDTTYSDSRKLYVLQTNLFADVTAGSFTITPRYNLTLKPADLFTVNAGSTALLQSTNAGIILYPGGGFPVAISNANLRLLNGRSIEGIDSAGSGEVLLTITGANNVFLRSFTVGGHLQLQARNASGQIQFYNPSSTLLAYYDTTGLHANLVSVNDDAYGVGWNGSTNVPTKNAVYDQMELRQPLDSDLTTIANNNPGNNYYFGTDGSGVKGFYTFPSAVTITNYATFAMSDLTTTLTSGGNKAFWRPPYNIRIVSIKAAVLTASSSGAITVDVEEGGTTIFSTALTIDATENDSADAATPAVISDTDIAANAEMTFDIDGAGSNAAGLQVTFAFIRI